MKRRYIPLLAALLLVPALARAQMYSISDVREQAQALGRWTQTYTDKYGRELLPPYGNYFHSIAWS